MNKSEEAENRSLLNVPEAPHVSSLEGENTISSVRSILESVYAGEPLPELFDGDGLRDPAFVASFDSLDPRVKDALVAGYENPTAFLTTLIQFAEERETIAEQNFADDPKLLHACGEMHEAFFRSTGSVDEDISLFDRLRLITRATRIRAIRKNFGGHFNSGLTYSFAFAGDEMVTRIEERLAELSVCEQIDILQQLETVAADATANGQWSRPALERIQSLYTHLAETEGSAVLVSMAAKIALSRVENEYANPQLGVVRRTGQENDSRISTLLSSERGGIYRDKSNELARRMRTNIPPNRAAWFAPLGSDALVAFDSTLTPIAFAKYSEELLPEPVDLDPRKYDQLEAFLADNRWRPEDIHAAVGAYLRFTQGSKSTSIEEDAERLSKVIPTIEKSLWTDLLTGIAEVQVYQRSEQEMMAEAAEHNKRASERAISDTALLFENLLKKKELKSWLRDSIQAFQASIAGEDFEKQYEIASEVWLGCRHEQEQAVDMPEILQLAQIGEQIRATHTQNFAIAQKNAENLREHISNEKADVLARYGDAEDKIVQQHAEIRDTLLLVTQEEKQTLFSSLPQVTFRSWSELSEDPTMYPFGVPGSPAEHQLALRTLHNLDLRMEIEKRFNLDFSRIPLRSQLHLFEFLADRDRSPAIRFKTLSTQWDEDASDFAAAFLAGSEGSEGNDLVLAVAEQLPLHISAQIFKNYANIARNIDSTRDELQRIFNVNPDDALLRDTIQALITRSNTLMKQVLQDPKSSQVLARLERASAESELFTAAFRTLKESRNIQFEEVKDISFSVEQGTEFGMDKAAIEKAKKLFEEAYSQESEKFKDAVLSEFSSALQNPNSHFYVLRYLNEPASLLRFDEIYSENGELTKLYFGSFVSDAALGNGKLGEALFEEALKREKARNVPIEANSNPLSPISQKYIESGFVATKLGDYADVPSFSIIWDTDLNSRSMTKKWSSEQIISAALAQDTENIKVYGVSNPNEIPFNLVNEGFVLTRYLKQGNRVYAVFEKVPQASEGGFANGSA